MRCSKLLTLLLAVVFLLTTVVPLFAWDGGGRWQIKIEEDEDHPWQDGDDPPPMGAIPPVSVGPVIITIGIDIPLLAKRFFGGDNPKPTKLQALGVKKTTSSRFTRSTGRQVAK